MSSIQPPNSSNLNIRATTSQANVLKISGNTATVTFGGKTWEITVTDQDNNNDIDLTNARNLVDRIAQVFQALVANNIIDPNKHQTAEIKETSKGGSFESTVFVTENNKSEEVQITDTVARNSLGDFNTYLKTQAAQKFLRFSPRNISDLTTAQKAGMIETILAKQPYDKKFVSFDVDSKETPLTAFLGNSYPTRVTYKEKTYKCAESAYQAQKIAYIDTNKLDKTNLEKIAKSTTPPSVEINTESAQKFKESLSKALEQADGKQALAIGKFLEDNELVKEGFNNSSKAFMKDILKAKFKDPALQQLLQATGNSYLIAHRYENDGKDQFWSDGWDGKKFEGSNNLGELLMEIRDDSKIPPPPIKPTLESYIYEFYESKNPPFSKDTIQKFLADWNTLQDKKTSTDKITIGIQQFEAHKDVGGGGQCAALSLAHQIFILDNNGKQPTETLTKEAAQIRKDAVENIKKLIEKDSLLRAYILVACKEKQVLKMLKPEMQKIVEDPSFQTKENLIKLAKAYADLMEKEDFYLDLPFFYAYQKANTDYTIHILRDYALGSELNSKNPHFKTLAKLGEGKENLYVWYNGRNHYHSFTLPNSLDMEEDAHGVELDPHDYID